MFHVKHLGRSNMPTKKVEATNFNILRAMQRAGTFSADNRIPEITLQSIDSVYQRILDFRPTRNKFMETLFDVVVPGEINAAFFKNPMRDVKKSPMRYGATEQEIFVNMMRGVPFDQFADCDTLFGYYVDNVLTAYHTLTPAIQYQQTYTFDNLRTAFTSEYGIRDLIAGKSQAMYASCEYDEYLSSKRLLESAYANGNVHIITIPDPIDLDTSKQFTIKMRALIQQMYFPHPEYTLAGADSSSYDSGIYYITTPEVDAVLDVELLSYAFHDSKVELNARKIIVDKFDNPAIKAAVFDVRWFKIRDNFKIESDSKNGASLNWNIFLTNSMMYSYSPFFAMTVFTTETQTITGITVTETSITGMRGQTVKIPYTVTGSGYVSQAADFSISGNNSKHTFMLPGSNVLHIGLDETSPTITVNIGSRVTPTVTATAAVAVSGNT